MKDLFDPRVVEEMKLRVSALRPASERQWGSLSVVQMLAHCTAGMEMAMGELRAKPAPFPGSLLGRAIKPLVLGGDRPMRRNSPSSPELFTADPTRCDLEAERLRLIVAIDRFAAQGEAGCPVSPHPFFGPLRPREWAILVYKHLDHHLRQFGV